MQSTQNDGLRGVNYYRFMILSSSIMEFVFYRMQNDYQFENLKKFIIPYRKDLQLMTFEKLSMFAWVNSHSIFERMIRLYEYKPAG